MGVLCSDTVSTATSFISKHTLGIVVGGAGRCSLPPTLPVTAGRSANGQPLGQRAEHDGGGWHLNTASPRESARYAVVLNAVRVNPS